MDSGLRFQQVPASSTGEAEYRALSIAVKELIWVKMILETLGFQVEEPMIVYEDNQCALKVAKRPGAQKRTKHVDVRHHYIRHLEEAGCIKVCIYIHQEAKGGYVNKEPTEGTAGKVGPGATYSRSI